MFEKLKIISLNVHHLTFNESLEQVTEYAIKRKPYYVCFANVHMTIEAYSDKQFLEKINNTDLVLADGKPIAFSCKLLHHRKQERISGMDFTPRILEKANEKKLSVFIYGSTPDNIRAAQEKINSVYPNIFFSGSISPPFRQLSEDEIKADIDKINLSNPNIVMVALGCPKQEKWMADNSAKINAVLLGIGGALPVFAGIEKRAPKWMQNMALEWFYRLIQQPRRLFTRYLYTNSYFLFLLGRDYIKSLFKN